MHVYISQGLNVHTAICNNLREPQIQFAHVKVVRIGAERTAVARRCLLCALSAVSSINPYIGHKNTLVYSLRANDTIALIQNQGRVFSFLFSFNLFPHTPHHDITFNLQYIPSDAARRPGSQHTKRQQPQLVPIDSIQ